MKVTVTGAAGNLGSQTLQLLWENGYEVRATDQNYRRDLPVRVEIGSLLDRESCYAFMEGSEALVHLGNHPHFHGGDHQRIFNENVTMNMNAFQAAVDVGVKRIVFASSIQAVGGYLSRESRERGAAIPSFPIGGTLPAKPNNPYGLSKEVGERTLRYFTDLHGITGFAIRFPFLANGLTRSSAQKWASRTPWGSPSNVFSWLDVRDAAALIDVLLRSDLTGFHTFMPTAPLIDALGESIPALSETHFPGVPWSVPAQDATAFLDIGEIKAATGWEPAILSPFPD